MNAPLGEVNTEAGPPLAIPLQHFFVGLVFLVAGVFAGALASLRSAYLLPHVYLLLVGWVCVTIMGAMTQFVPVWSDVSLHSRRLAQAQLVLVVVGVVGLAAAFASGCYAATAFPGAVLLAGFWIFVFHIPDQPASISPPKPCRRISLSPFRPSGRRASDSRLD